MQRHSKFIVLGNKSGTHSTGSFISALCGTSSPSFRRVECEGGAYQGIFDSSAATTTSRRWMSQGFINTRVLLSEYENRGGQRGAAGDFLKNIRASEGENETSSTSSNAGEERLSKAGEKGRDSDGDKKVLRSSLEDNDLEDDPLWKDCDTIEDIMQEEMYGAEGEEAPPVITPEITVLALKALAYGTILAIIGTGITAVVVAYNAGFQSLDEIHEHIRGRDERELERIRAEGGEVLKFEMDLTKPDEMAEQAKVIFAYVQKAAEGEGDGTLEVIPSKPESQGAIGKVKAFWNGE